MEREAKEVMPLGSNISETEEEKKQLGRLAITTFKSALSVLGITVGFNSDGWRGLFIPCSELFTAVFLTG